MNWQPVVKVLVGAAIGGAINGIQTALTSQDFLNLPGVDQSLVAAVVGAIIAVVYHFQKSPAQLKADQKKIEGSK